jgi:hypothetical protein
VTTTARFSPFAEPIMQVDASPPDLTWVAEPIPECLACGGAVEPEEAELAVAGPEGFPDAPGYLAVMGRCRACGRGYSLLDTLIEIAGREGWNASKPRAPFGSTGRKRRPIP